MPATTPAHGVDCGGLVGAADVGTTARVVDGAALNAVVGAIAG